MEFEINQLLVSVGTFTDFSKSCTETLLITFKNIVVETLNAYRKISSVVKINDNKSQVLIS